MQRYRIKCKWLNKERSLTGYIETNDKLVQHITVEALQTDAQQNDKDEFTRTYQQINYVSTVQTVSRLVIL